MTDRIETEAQEPVAWPPERIWAGSPSMCGNAFGDWDTIQGHDGDVEYIRADLATSAPVLRLSIERKIGMWGAAYDGPQDARAYTYQQQPANGPAWKIGKAASAAAKDTAGDYIDRGLGLLRHLQDVGFGVFSLVKDEAATPAPVEGNALSNAARDVLTERQRQITVEGWSPKRDDAYQAGDLGNAAACYAMTDPVIDPDRPAPVDWPWAASWWKPTDRRRDLVKAGALILAEIERLDRATAQKGEA